MKIKVLFFRKMCFLSNKSLVVLLSSASNSFHKILLTVVEFHLIQQNHEHLDQLKIKDDFKSGACERGLLFFISGSRYKPSEPQQPETQMYFKILAFCFQRENALCKT